MREAGRLWDFARLIAGNEPLEVRKRSPQILDRFVGVRLGFFVVPFSRALLPFEPQQTHFRKVCVVTPAGVPGWCAETPTLYLLGASKLQNIFCEREQRTVLISLRTRSWRAFRQFGQRQSSCQNS